MPGNLGNDHDLEGAPGGYEEGQEVPPKVDIASCWKIISVQEERLKKQESFMNQMATQMVQLQQQLATLISSPPTGPPTNPPQDPNKDPPVDTKLSVTDLLKVLNKKGTPAPEPFSLSSGRNFDNFLYQFENHCKGKYDSDSYDRWTPDLGFFLRDEILKMYHVYGGGDIKFDEMKLKLRSFCVAEETRSKTKRVEKFVSARPGPDETLSIYALRLERLYISAHPGRTVEDSIELQTKFLSSLPQNDQLELNRELDTMKNAQEKEMIPWSKLLLVVKRRSDREQSIKSIVKTEDPSSNPIWFTSTNVPQFNDVGMVTYPGPSNEWFPVTGYNNYGYKNPHFQNQQQKFRYSNPAFNGNHNPYGNTNKPRGRSISRDARRNGGAGDFYQGRSRSLSQNRCQNQKPPVNPKNSQSWNNKHNFQEIICNWCGIPGHEEKVCWRKQGACYRCGSFEHLIRDCPKPPRNMHRRPYSYQTNSNPMNNMSSSVNHPNQSHQSEANQMSSLNANAPVFQTDSVQGASLNVNAPV